MTERCERDGCGADRCETWPFRGKLLCQFCWRAAMRLGGSVPMRLRKAANDAVRIIEQGGSDKAAETYFKFAQACINHGLIPGRPA